MSPIAGRRHLPPTTSSTLSLAALTRPRHPHADRPPSPRRRGTHSYADASRGAALSPAKLSRLIEQRARQPPSPLTLSKLLSFARPLTQESVLRSVQYVFAEIPRMMAQRARSLEALPFIVGMNPFIARTLQAHRRSIEFLVTHPPVRTLEENAAFIEHLADLVQSHANDIPAMAKGCVVPLPLFVSWPASDRTQPPRADSRSARGT